jgi:hypothetical protein
MTDKLGVIEVTEVDDISAVPRDQRHWLLVGDLAKTVTQ